MNHGSWKSALMHGNTIQSFTAGIWCHTVGNYTKNFTLRHPCMELCDKGPLIWRELKVLSGRLEAAQSTERFWCWIRPTAFHQLHSLPPAPSATSLRQNANPDLFLTTVADRWKSPGNHHKGTFVLLWQKRSLGLKKWVWEGTNVAATNVLIISQELVRTHPPKNSAR